MTHTNGRADVWKWVAGILLAILTTGAAMLIREDWTHREMRLAIEENTDANLAAVDSQRALEKTVNELSLLLRAHRITFEALEPGRNMEDGP